MKVKSESEVAQSCLTLVQIQLRRQHEKLNLIVKYINITDCQEESDRSNQGVASTDYTEPLFTNHASSNHHVLVSCYNYAKIPNGFPLHLQMIQTSHVAYKHNILWLPLFF